MCFELFVFLILDFFKNLCWYWMAKGYRYSRFFKNVSSFMSWICVYCKASKESFVAEQLRQVGVETYLPLVNKKFRRQGKVVERQQAMFPNYLFAQVESDNTERVRLISYIKGGDDVIMLSENESVFVPLGVVHRLENPGKVDLEIIEVQSGTYLGEDDIVRLEDNYGR